MRDERGFTGSQIALAILGGAAAGAAMAMLTAPKSGRETRQQLSGYLSRGKNRSAHLPEAVRSATLAAREAFDGAMAEVERDMARVQ